MRNPLRLLGLFRSGDRRRPATGRGYTPSAAPARRYEVPRTGSAADMRPPARRMQRAEVNWRRRGMIALASLGAIGVLTGAGWLFRSDAVRVRVIDVNGTQVADPQAVASAAGVAGASLLVLDVAQAARQVAELPAVKSATVTREWPQGIRIDITEYQAWGYWQAGAQRLVIDEEGRVLEQSRPPAADAPTIVEVLSGTPDPTNPANPGGTSGASADPDTVRLVNRLRTDGTFDRLQVRPTSYVFRSDRGLTVIVADGPSAVLGDSSNYDFKVRTWQSLLDKVRAGQVPRVHVAAPSPTPTRTPASEDDATRAARVTATPPSAPLSSSSAMVSEIDLRFGRNVVLR